MGKIVEIDVSTKIGKREDGKGIIETQMVIPWELHEPVFTRFKQGLDLLVKAIIESIDGTTVGYQKAEFNGSDANEMADVPPDVFFATKRKWTN